MPACYYASKNHCGAMYFEAIPLGWNKVTCMRCATVLGYACRSCSVEDVQEECFPPASCPANMSPSTSAGALDDTREDLGGARDRPDERNPPMPRPSPSLSPTGLGRPPGGGLLDRHRNAVLLVLCMLAIAGWVSAALIWANSREVQKSNSAAQEESAAKSKEMLRINRKLMEVRDPLLEKIGKTRVAVWAALRNKEKLTEPDVRALQEALLDSLDDEGARARSQLDALERDARKKLDGESLRDALTQIKASRDFLSRVEQNRNQLNDELRLLIFKRVAEGPGLQLEKGVKDAFKKIQDALNELNEKENKPRDK